MCGIAGIINFKAAPDMAALQRMMEVIVHRGPDGSGYFSEESIAFGHRRLAIVDRSEAGKQPMEYLNRYVITYNGEVYNHIELRKELERSGYQFHSHTDTEVIMAAYDYWGKECLHRFNGMFAFALYDRVKKDILLARDRFGVKPFYYYIGSDGALYFASEIKQFTTITSWQASINPQRTYDYLNWGVTDHTSETLFAAVFQLRGGECLTIDLNKPCFSSNHEGFIHPERWYSLTNTSRVISSNPTEDFKNLLQDSVRLRLRADVKVGSCLSGGLDSSSIVCIANRLLREQGSSENQKTFSACAIVKEFDEKEYMDEVVDKTRVEAYHIYPNHTALFEQLEQLVWHQDEPFGSTSIFAQWCVFKLANESGVTVMLDGQGADEQLAGYHGYFAKRYASLFKQLKLIKLGKEICAAKKKHGYSIYRSLQYLMNGILPEKIRHYARAWAGKAKLAPAWLDLTKLGAQSQTPFVEEDRSTTLLAFSKAQLTSTHLPMLLRWEDRNSMAHSIEARVPFLDYRLAEYIYGLPDELKLSDGITKRILRDSMRGILPERIRMRMDKKGFLTPESLWLKDNANKFREQLNTTIELTNGFLKPQETRQLFEEIVSGQKKFSFVLWRIICFGLWVKKFDIKI